MDKKIFLLCVILLIVLSACGPSAEVITLTIVAEMDHAATLAVPTATATLAATSTPVPTHTPTATTVPTKTPISDPDINAMINWQALNLDSSFEAVAPASIGFEKGAIAFGLSLASGDIVYIIENSFVFENSDEQVYGYAVNLKDDVEGAIINLMIPEWENRVESTFNSGGKTLQDFNTISGKSVV